MKDLREVLIEWNDTPDEVYLVWVGIGEVCGDGTPEDDDGVFFWFADEQEFEQAKTGEGFEFTLSEWDGM